MALSSGGWAPPAPVSASSQQVACGGAAPTACCSTVLMSVRVSVCHSGIRPLCLPGAGSEALRLQLSMDPSRAGEFRLALRDMSGNRSVVSCYSDPLRIEIETIKRFCFDPIKCIIRHFIELQKMKPLRIECDFSERILLQRHPFATKSSLIGCC